MTDTDIELIKKHLNTEKVFYNLNWHELVPQDGSNDSGLEGTSSSHYGKSSSKKNKKSLRRRRRNTNKTPMTSPITRINSDNVSIKHSISSFLEEEEIFGVSTRKSYSPPHIVLANEKCSVFPKTCWPRSVMLCMLKCFNMQPKCLSRGESNEYIHEIENIESTLTVDMKPPVDILYNVHRIVLLFFISGIIENFKIAFDPSTRILKISGYRLPYQSFPERSFIYHEIKQGYFERHFLLKKLIIESELTHINEKGVIKINIPLKQEECPDI